MNILFGEASKDDIKELIRLRIAYMIDDFGGVSNHERECMEKQLPDYFNKKLGNELIAFIAKDDNRIVSVAYLHIIEMPANSILLNGLYGEVLNVYTEPKYRGKGICTQLIKNLIEYGEKRGLGRVDLSATKEGYPIYKKVGFVDKEHRYTDMRYKY
ncbi:MAG: GNAT family N-acetyltransferase [Lachnospiraceae bacterium]|nr:GNAT family N-acetyltransferase [Lachnospiraceae bacterium]